MENKHQKQQKSPMNAMCKYMLTSFKQNVAYLPYPFVDETSRGLSGMDDFRPRHLKGKTERIERVAKGWKKLTHNTCIFNILCLYVTLFTVHLYLW